MTGKRKLELTWVGKEERPRLEPRLLVEDEGLSYGETPEGEAPGFLIQGDNLLALKALEAEPGMAGSVKCCFIDPPYNTGSAFAHYDDGLEHSIWLSMMRDRLEVIRRLLSDDGSLWVTLDDNEAHYFKVMADEVFGRECFVTTNIWENFYGRSNAAAISPAHNYVLVYAKNGKNWKFTRQLLPRDAASASKYKNPDNDPRGAWRLGPIFAPEERHAGLMYTIHTPTGRAVCPPRGSHWRMTEPDFWRLVDEGRVTFGASGDNNPAIKLYLREVQEGVVPRTWWPHTEVGHSQEAKREIQALFPENLPFETPKPERLLHRILTIATNPGDLVLDSFAGSGTTGAVAHKMGRRWIMVEIGEHARTHIVPRLRKVIDGTDRGGVTEATSWQGGGAFRFCRLAPTLIVRDRWGREVINPAYDAAMLVQALCKLEGFRFSPSETEWWRHGQSTETDFLHATTQTLSHAQLQELSEAVGEGRTLLVLCAAWIGDAGAFPNLTVRKIPQHVLGRCEWGRDDYGLPVGATPEAAE